MKFTSKDDFINSKYVGYLFICLMFDFTYKRKLKHRITATSTTGQSFRLALVSAMSVLSSISMLFCLLEGAPPSLVKHALLVSIGVTLINKSLFLCFCFQIWSADPPWNFNWTKVSWINQPLWNNSDGGGGDWCC